MYREIFKKMKNKYDNNRKSQIDKQAIESYLIFRPLSFLITPFFVMTKVSANFVTFLSFVFFCITGVLFLKGPDFFCLSAGMFFCATLLDYVDGNLSRYWGTSSYLGKFLDGICGVVGICFVQICLIIFSMKQLSFTLQICFLLVFFLDVLIGFINAKYVMLNYEIIKIYGDDVVKKEGQKKVKQLIVYRVINAFLQLKTLAFIFTLVIVGSSKNLSLYLYIYGTYMLFWFILNIAKVFYKVLGWSKIHRDF